MRPILYRIPVPMAGDLSTMALPRGGDWLDADMTALRDEGVDVLVSLQTDVERRDFGLTGEADAAARAGIEFHTFPIEDFRVPDRERIQPLLDTLSGYVRDGRHVVVHCLAGIGRSSLVAASVLTRLGATPDRAWQVISEARGCRVPENDQQRQWLT